ncbi:unnamed protein product [Amoebophrya sp. A120]|nr:unnamed protein product [Amoebophrya sp. A120]|eukprot:GSA120T00008789001.1
MTTPVDHEGESIHTGYTTWTLMYGDPLYGGNVLGTAGYINPLVDDKCFNVEPLGGSPFHQPYGPAFDLYAIARTLADLFGEPGVEDGGNEKVFLGERSEEPWHVARENLQKVYPGGPGRGGSYDLLTKPAPDGEQLYQNYILNPYQESRKGRPFSAALTVASLVTITPSSFSGQGQHEDHVTYIKKHQLQSGNTLTLPTLREGQKGAPWPNNIKADGLVVQKSIPDHDKLKELQRQVQNDARTPPPVAGAGAPVSSGGPGWISSGFAPAPGGGMATASPPVLSPFEPANPAGLWDSRSPLGMPSQPDGGPDFSVGSGVSRSSSTGSPVLRPPCSSMPNQPDGGPDFISVGSGVSRSSSAGSRLVHPPSPPVAQGGASSLPAYAGHGHSTGRSAPSLPQPASSLAAAARSGAPSLPQPASSLAAGGRGGASAGLRTSSHATAVSGSPPAVSRPGGSQQGQWPDRLRAGESSSSCLQDGGACAGSEGHDQGDGPVAP